MWDCTLYVGKPDLREMLPHLATLHDRSIEFVRGKAHTGGNTAPHPVLSVGMNRLDTLAKETHRQTSTFPRKSCCHIGCPAAFACDRTDAYRLAPFD